MIAYLQTGRATVKAPYTVNIIHKSVFYFQDIIDNTTCRNPYEMTEDQLVNELTERGKDTKGSREQLIDRLVQLDKGDVM